MLKRRIFKKAFWMLMLTGIINWFSVKLYLYWAFWWMDMVVHFLGGLSVGLAVLWFCSRKDDFKDWSPKKILLYSLIGAILIGILWELFELYFGITSLSDGVGYWTDTLSDLLMDSIGGVFAFLSVHRMINKSLENK